MDEVKRSSIPSVLLLSVGLPFGVGQMAQAAEAVEPSLTNFIYSLFAGFTVLLAAGAFLLANRRA